MRDFQPIELTTEEKKTKALQEVFGALGMLSQDEKRTVLATAAIFYGFGVVHD